MEAPEIIINVWKTKQEMLSAGRKPERLIISPANYRKLKSYKESLGELPNPDMDYLQKETLFGIPLFIDDATPLVVE